MKSLLVSLAVALFSVGVAACGGSEKGAGSSPRASSNAPTTSAAPTTPVLNTTSTLRRLEGDEDDDETPGNSTASNSNDNDADFDNDRKNESTGYYDSDDNSIRAYGRAASSAEKQAITAVVKRYYAAAAAGDGATACSMIYSTRVQAIPEDYGREPGPAYLRGKSCAVVMSKLFKHSHSESIGAIEVVGVRVNGTQARALVGSTTMPAGFTIVRRERGAWKIDGLLSSQLP